VGKAAEGGGQEVDVSYHHTQTGWPVRIAFGVTALGFLALTAVNPLDRPLPSAVLFGGALVAAALALIWSRLTVRIDGERLAWAFGPGWPRYSLPLRDIAAVESTRTTFWQGWGIHRGRGGWIYNIAGRDAIRITRHDGRQVLLGTDEPRRLKAALERALGRGGARR
jgi:hypothetical protein